MQEYAERENLDAITNKKLCIRSFSSSTPFKARENGERGRNRTFNLLIKSQLLCQLSYAPFVGIVDLGGTDSV